MSSTVNIPILPMLRLYGLRHKRTRQWYRFPSGCVAAFQARREAGANISPLHADTYEIAEFADGEYEALAFAEGRPT